MCAKSSMNSLDVGGRRKVPSWPANMGATRLQLWLVSLSDFGIGLLQPSQAVDKLKTLVGDFESSLAVVISYKSWIFQEIF